MRYMQSPVQITIKQNNNKNQVKQEQIFNFYQSDVAIKLN